jgi:hypothetical protein
MRSSPRRPRRSRRRSASRRRRAPWPPRLRPDTADLLASRTFEDAVLVLSGLPQRAGKARLGAGLLSVVEPRLIGGAGVGRTSPRTPRGSRSGWRDRIRRRGRARAASARSRKTGRTTALPGEVLRLRRRLKALGFCAEIFPIVFPLRSPVALLAIMPRDGAQTCPMSVSRRR